MPLVRGLVITGEFMQDIGRRRLLGVSGQAALAVAAGAGLRAGNGRVLVTVPRARQPDWDGLARRLRGRLLRPGDPGFAAASVPYNRRYADVRPGGVAVCADAGDARTALLWARDQGVPFAVRSGGHSYAGFCASRGLVISLAALNSVTVSERSMTVTAGAGARNLDIYAAIAGTGLAVPGGRCPTVAVGGLLLGGGFGFSSRHLGLTCDHLLQTEAVTADGDILRVTPECHRDLFWACQGGGGGNFAINTRYRLAAVRVGRVAVYRLSWHWADAQAVITAMLRVMLDAPGKMSCRIGADVSGGGPATGRPASRAVSALGLYFGTAAQLTRLLAPVLAAARPASTLIEETSYDAAQAVLAKNVPAGAFASRSRYLDTGLPEQAIDDLLRQAERWPGSSNPDGGGFTIFAWGGAISEVAPEATAFVHRTPRFLADTETTWTREDSPAVAAANLNWLNATYAILTRYGTTQAYQNFTDPALHHWAAAYYGRNLPRLTQVKHAYDPDNVFRFAQSIPEPPRLANTLTLCKPDPGCTGTGRFALAATPPPRMTGQPVNRVSAWRVLIPGRTGELGARMRKDLTVGVAALTILLTSAVMPAAASAAVPATAGAGAILLSVSCSKAGNCAAGGFYDDASLRSHAFVVTEKNGRWGSAVELPGLMAHGAQGGQVTAVSCAPAGGCTAVGYYQAASRWDVFATSEQNGKWSRPAAVFSSSSEGAVDTVSLSCSARGNCVLGGGWPPFLISEVNGRWNRALKYTATAKFGGVALSCVSAGNCAAGWGTVVVSERNGRWGKPVQVPGLRALGTNATIGSVSCTSAVNCAASGSYQVSTYNTEVFVASERGGHWGKAIELPGYNALNQAGTGDGVSVSCMSAGNCIAGGNYAANAGFFGGAYEAFVAAERNGHWRKAFEVPGIPPPSTARCEPDSDACVAGNVQPVSCAPGGSCALGGWYDTPAIDGRAAFLASYKNGRWSNIVRVAGLAVHGSPDSAVNSMSCPASGSCTAGGSYPAFVVSEKDGTWGKAQLIRF